MIRENRDTPRDYLSNQSWASCTQIFPLKDIACVLLAQTKDAKIVCVIGNNEDTDPHTSWRLASARHDIKETVFLPECTFLQTDQSVKTKKRMMYSPGGPYIMVAPIVKSWLSPANGWCFYICIFRHESRWRRSPIATPRGRSSKFPWRGTWLKKNFQHARIISTMEFSSVCFSTVFCYKEKRSVIALAIYLFYIWLFILLIICIVNLVLWCSVYKDFSNVI